MDKFAEALGPWPILQLFFGVAVLGVGVYATIRGLASRQSPMSMEEARQEWEAYQQLESIEQHARAIAENQKLMLDRIIMATEAIKQMTNALNALASAIWNQRQ